MYRVFLSVRSDAGSATRQAGKETHRPDNEDDDREWRVEYKILERDGEDARHDRQPKHADDDRSGDGEDLQPAG